MTYYMYIYFIQTLIIRCTVSEILADNRSQKSKLDLSDLENDLKSDSILFILYDRMSFITEKLHDAIHLGSTSLHSMKSIS